MMELTEQQLNCLGGKHEWDRETQPLVVAPVDGDAMSHLNITCEEDEIVLFVEAQYAPTIDGKETELRRQIGVCKHCQCVFAEKP